MSGGMQEPTASYLAVVALEELQEAGLCASRPLHTPESQVISGSLQVPQVHCQVLQPQTCPLPHRGQLGRSARHAETHMHQADKADLHPDDGSGSSEGKKVT